MKCGQCYSEDTKVIESRDVSDGQAVRRRRACVNFGYCFTTYERVERPQLIVIKNNGTRELFSRQKLLAGLYRACEKTSVSSMQPVSYTHLRAHETDSYLVCRLL